VLDPFSKMPAFKVCAVALTALGPSDEDPATAKEPTVHTTPRFLQGVFPFQGQGMEKPTVISSALRYAVPDGVVAQALYFRGGNSSEELITVVLLREGVPMRYFPIGAKGDVHVPLRVVEDLPAGTVLELQVSAPDGLSGTIVVDLGLVEV
jgi:assimilatory nitrate reductase catalytic subunit